MKESSVPCVTGAASLERAKQDAAMWFIGKELRQSDRRRPARNPLGWWWLRPDLRVTRRHRGTTATPPRSLSSNRKHHQRRARWILSQPLRMTCTESRESPRSFSLLMFRSRGTSAFLLTAALNLRALEPLYVLRYLRLPAIHYVVRRALPSARACRDATHRRRSRVRSPMS